jgi:hypothetical protein
MPKQKRRDTPAKQSQRFVETAKALGVDESGKEFERALKIIHPPVKAKRRKATLS